MAMDEAKKLPVILCEMDLKGQDKSFDRLAGSLVKSNAWVGRW